MRSWPDYPERSARTNLSNALSNLRAVLGDRKADRAERGPPYLLVTRETIQLNGDADQWVDVTAFDALVDARRWEEALSSSEELAVPEELARALCGLGAVALATGDLSAARQRHRRALQVALEDKSVDTSRLTLVSVAKLCMHAGERELAVELVVLTLRVRPSFWRESIRWCKCSIRGAAV